MNSCTIQRQTSRPEHRFIGLLLPLLVGMILLPSQANAGTVLEWDFSRGMQGWKGNHHVTDLVYSRQGLSFAATGVDPWIEGPAVNLQTDRLIKVTIRMKSNANSTGELFYGQYFQAGHSVRFAVDNDGNWHEYELIITESLGSNTRFRLDPATSAGRIAVAFIRVDELIRWNDPPYRKPAMPEPERRTAGKVTSGSVTLEYVGTQIGDFLIEVDGREMATGYSNELLGTLFDEDIEWLDLNRSSVITESAPDGFSLTAHLSDSRGADWTIRRDILPGPIDGTIEMQVRIQVDADRDVMCVPWLTVFPGLSTFGAHKEQALFAGLEYLSDEPSSSEADIGAPGHIRRVPDPVKVTFPLMAISAGKRYIGLIWEPSEWLGPIFDSPDRIFGSDAHVMGLTGPVVGPNRFENSLLAHTPTRLAANEPITARIWIIGGEGKPCCQQYAPM